MDIFHWRTADSQKATALLQKPLERFIWMGFPEQNTVAPPGSMQTQPLEPMHRPRGAQLCKCAALVGHRPLCSAPAGEPELGTLHISAPAGQGEDQGEFHFPNGLLLVVEGRRAEPGREPKAASEVSTTVGRAPKQWRRDRAPGWLSR